MTTVRRRYLEKKPSSEVKYPLFVDNCAIAFLKTFLPSNDQVQLVFN